MSRKDFEAMYGDDIPPDPDDMYLRNGRPLNACAVAAILFLAMWVIIGLVVWAVVRP